MNLKKLDQKQISTIYRCLFTEFSRCSGVQDAIERSIKDHCPSQHTLVNDDVMRCLSDTQSKIYELEQLMDYVDRFRVSPTEESKD